MNAQRVEPMTGQAAERASRALDATSDLTELLKLAHSAIHRAQADTHGEAYHLALRLSRHMQYMRKVAELLRHEIQRFEDAPAESQPTKSIASPTRLPLRVGALAVSAER